MRKATKLVAAASVAAIALTATIAEARHSWGKYAWAYSGSPIAAPVVDNTSGSWPGRVAIAVDDWNVSSRIDARLTKGTNSGCDFILGTIQVCNANYGDTGWLGIASISINGNEIIAGNTKLNDFYFAQPQYSSESWKQLVTCQEIGHDYGLAHQNENFMTDQTTSCMEYTSWPEGNEHPDAHDYAQLETIYSSGGGKKGGGGGKPGSRQNAPGNTPAAWGTPIDYLPNGKPFVFERRMNGYRVITHVTWTLEAAGEQGDHHHGHSH